MESLVTDIDFEALASANQYCVDHDGDDQNKRWSWYNYYLYFGTDYIYSSEQEAWKAACYDNKLI
jgi:hypothetical protein